ncbi:Uncharacterised protein [Vibrio cholerae]|nr:Uncharacterised protein [Vibrio cholerae]CSI55049.1 Uncharacterised protein [Vibrio cholerae]CSI61537.1 Uncharacterised protein [Vibrio cholerae]
MSSAVPHHCHRSLRHAPSCRAELNAAPPLSEFSLADRDYRLPNRPRSMNRDRRRFSCAFRPLSDWRKSHTTNLRNEYHALMRAPLPPCYPAQHYRQSPPTTQ